VPAKQPERPKGFEKKILYFSTWIVTAPSEGLLFKKPLLLVL
jgi:hypothetical protein